MIFAIIPIICQSEHINHTLAIARKRTVIVHAGRLKLDAPYSSAARRKVALGLRSKRIITPLAEKRRYYCYNTSVCLQQPIDFTGTAASATFIATGEPFVRAV